MQGDIHIVAYQYSGLKEIFNPAYEIAKYMGLITDKNKTIQVAVTPRRIYMKIYRSI